MEVAFVLAFEDASFSPMGVAGSALQPGGGWSMPTGRDSSFEPFPEESAVLSHYVLTHGAAESALQLVERVVCANDQRTRPFTLSPWPGRKLSRDVFIRDS